MNTSKHRILVIENFITPEDAQILVDEQNSPSEVNPYPDRYSTYYGGTGFPYNKRTMDILIKYGLKSNEVHREANGFVNPIYVFKTFGSHWVAGTQGGLHVDAQDPEAFIEFSTIMYLNSPEEYDGGTIYFPNQNFEYKPKQYSAVFFPSAGSEHLHGISEVTRGHRYTGLYMHTSIPKHADPDFHTEEETKEWKAFQYVPKLS
jgi:hypothetical protein